MITPVIVAIIGCKVFPDISWAFILYVAYMGVALIIKALWEISK